MRYSRQELIVGKEGQEKIRKSTVVIVGVGALGTVSAELLARAGIGTLILIDRDIVELNNLQRQVLFTESDVGKSKAVQAQERLEKINSGVRIESYPEDLTEKNINKLIHGDLILDCTDNMETRFLINDYAKKNNIPWVYAAAIQDKGLVMNILPDGPCFQCAFKDRASVDTCETSGVLNTITTMIASLQVTEAMKMITGRDVEHDLISLHVTDKTMDKIKVNKNPDCPTCNKTFEYLEGKKVSPMIKQCGTGNYQVHFDERPLREVKRKLENMATVIDLGYGLKFENMTIFKDRALIHASNEQEAKSTFAKYMGN